MTRTELKSARHALGLSARGLACALGMSPSSGRTVRRWERGEFVVPGPVAKTVEMLLEGKAKGWLTIHEGRIGYYIPPRPNSRP